MQPANRAVFALDGILIGAGATRFLMWLMLAAGRRLPPVAPGSLALGLGIVGVWGGLAGLIVVRLATCGVRFAGRRWAITGPQSARDRGSAGAQRLGGVRPLLAAREWDERSGSRANRFAPIAEENF